MKWSYPISELKDVKLNFSSGGESWAFSQTLATQSRRFDSLLFDTPYQHPYQHDPTGKYKEITVDGLTKDQFERMMEYVTNPSAAFSMPVEHARELAPLYRNYDFEIGLKLCDNMLYCICNVLQLSTTEMLKNDAIGGNFDPDYTSKVNLCIELFQLSEVCNLPRTYQLGSKWAVDRTFHDLQVYEAGEAFPIYAFDATQLRKLEAVLTPTA